MKKSTLYLLLFLLSGSLKAQTQTDTDSSLFSFFGGGFLQIHGGAVYNITKDFQSILNNPNLVKIRVGGEEIGIPVLFKEKGIGYTGGFKSMGIFENGVMLGVGLDYSFLNQTKGEYAKMVLHGASIQGYLGKTIVNKNSFILYPYLGIGYYRYLLNITNVNAKELVRFDYLNLEQPSKSQLFSAHYAYFEVGMGAKKRLANKFTMGLEVGAYFSTTTHNFWKRDNKTITERPAPGLSGAFVKLTIDLFKFGKKSYILDTTAVEVQPVNLGTDTSKVKPMVQPKKVNKKKKSKEPVNYNELYFNTGKEGGPPPLPKPPSADSLKKSETKKRTIRVIDPNVKSKKKKKK